MVGIRLEAMPEHELAAWRHARDADGQPLPGPRPGERLEAVRVVVGDASGDVVVGGLLLGLEDEPDGRRRASLRLMQTTLADDDEQAWRSLLAAIDDRVRLQEADLVVTSVPPSRAAVFQRAGYAATMTTLAKRLDPDEAPELQDDRRVAVRPMLDDERRRFVDEVVVILREGMQRAGVLAGNDAGMTELGDRVARLLDDPPPGELLVTGTVDGTAVGRAWATLVTRDDGAVDFLGNTIDLFPEHRGQGLTKSFLGALVRHVRDLGIRDIHLRVYADDPGARRTFLDHGATITEVHLRKDRGVSRAARGAPGR